MAITLAEAQEQRTVWYAALLAVSTGQSYTLGTRSLTRVNLPEISREFSKWDQEVDRIEAGRTAGVAVRRTVIVDT